MDVRAARHPERPPARTLREVSDAAPPRTDGELIGLVCAKGDAEAVYDGVERVTGRPPRAYADWVQEHRSAFAG